MQIYVICENSCSKFTLYTVFDHVRLTVSQVIYPEVILLKLQSVFLLQHNLFSKKETNIQDLQNGNLQSSYGKQNCGCLEGCLRRDSRELSGMMKMFYLECGLQGCVHLSVHFTKYKLTTIKIK